MPDTKRPTELTLAFETKLKLAEGEDGDKKMEGLVIPWEGFARGYEVWMEFAEDAFDDVIDRVEAGGKVPLQEGHSYFEPGWPVGLAASLEKVDEGIYGVFRLANTSKAADAVNLVEDGITSGFSAGLMGIEWGDISRNSEEVLYTDIQHVALLHNPSFAEADNVQVFRAGRRPKTPKIDRWIHLKRR